MTESKPIPISTLQRIAREVPSIRYVKAYSNCDAQIVTYGEYTEIRVYSNGRVSISDDDGTVEESARALYEVLKLVFEPEIWRTDLDDAPKDRTLLLTDGKRIFLGEYVYHHAEVDRLAYHWRSDEGAIDPPFAFAEMPAPPKVKP